MFNRKVVLQVGLVQGVVSEDSDAFLFGAECVYKNIFSEKKYVEVGCNLIVLLWHDW